MVTQAEAQAELERRSRSSSPHYQLMRPAWEALGQERAPAPRRGQGVTPQEAQAELTRRAVAARHEQQRRLDYSTNAGRAAAYAHGGTFGAADELSGTVAGALTSAREALTPDDPVMAALRGRTENLSEFGQRVRGAADQAREDVTDRFRGDLEQYRQERPAEAMGTELAGGVLSPANKLIGGAVARLPGGAFLTRAAAGRGLPAFLAQSAQGAEAGVIGGGAYGFNTGEGDALDRLTNARDMAEVGGGLGAISPLAVNAARTVAAPLARLGRAAWNRFPTPAPNTLGALGGNLRMNGAPPPIDEPIHPDVANRLDALASRARLSADDLATEFRIARANPQGQVVADLFGDPGTRTMRTLTQGVGETGQRAQEVARERFREAPSRIVSALQRMLNVGESRTAALARLGQEYDTVSANQYRPVLDQPTTPQMREQFHQRIGDVLMDDPVMVNAERRAARVFARDHRAGLVRGQLQENLPRYLHYLKMGLDDAITAERRNPTGIQSTEMRGVMALRTRFLEAMDDIVPGYRNARQTWGGIANAEEALSEGADFLRMNPGEVAGRVKQMTPFELYHARVGLVDEIRHATRGGTNRSVNVAAKLDDPDIQRAIAAVFDNPQQAAEFLDNTVNTQYRLLDNAAQWRGGSQTASNLAHGEDMAGHAMAGAGHMALGHTTTGMTKIGHTMANFFTAGAAEQTNNRVGEVLLRRVDSNEAQRFSDQVVKLLRERQAARRQAAAASRAIAGGSATTSRRNSD